MTTTTEADFSRTFMRDFDLNSSQESQVPDPLDSLFKKRVEVSQAYEKSFRSARWHVTPNEENGQITKIAKWVLYAVTFTLILYFADKIDGEVPTLSQVLTKSSDHLAGEKFADLKEKVTEYQSLKRQFDQNPQASPILQNLIAKVSEENDVAYVQGRYDNTIGLVPDSGFDKHFQTIKNSEGDAAGAEYRTKEARELMGATTVQVEESEQEEVQVQLQILLSCGSYDVVKERINSLKENANQNKNDFPGLEKKYQAAKKAFAILNQALFKKCEDNDPKSYVKGVTQLQKDDALVMVNYDEERGVLALDLGFSLSTDNAKGYATIQTHLEVDLETHETKQSDKVFLNDDVIKKPFERTFGPDVNGRSQVIKLREFWQDVAQPSVDRLARFGV